MRYLIKYRTTVAWVLTWLVLGGTVAYAYTISEDNRKAVCTLRGDLRGRVNSGKKFLKRYPQGAFGFTTVEIQKGIRDQNRTIRALSGVRCSKEEELHE